jgi:hypothetical protein
LNFRLALAVLLTLAMAVASAAIGAIRTAKLKKPSGDLADRCHYNNASAAFVAC